MVLRVFVHLQIKEVEDLFVAWICQRVARRPPSPPNTPE